MCYGSACEYSTCCVVPSNVRLPASLLQVCTPLGIWHSWDLRACLFQLLLLCTVCYSTFNRRCSQVRALLMMHMHSHRYLELLPE
jgi:hypothetical protein